ncbi:MAG: PAS domain S-box protein [Desulfovibrionaceae bacterium]
MDRQLILDTILKTTRDGFWLISAEGFLRDVNTAYCTMSGYSKQELLAMHITELDAHESLVDVRERLHGIKFSGSEVFESTHRRKDGTIFDVEIATTWLHLSEGMFVAFLRDISQRKKNEAALRESEKNYRQLFEAESDAIFLIENNTGQILAANSAASSLYGYSQAELLAMRNVELSSEPEQTSHVTQTSPPDPGKVVHIPLRYHRKKNGETFPVEITGRFFVLQDRPVHIAAIRDITEKQNTIEALRASEERYALILKGSNDGFWDWDLVGNTVFFSDRWKEILGFGPEEVPNDVEQWSQRLHPEDTKRVIEENDRCRRGETPSFVVEYRMRHKDGSYRWIQGRGSSARDAEGRVVRLSGTHSDITARKEAEQKLRESTALLDTAARIARFGGWSVNLVQNKVVWSDQVAAIHDMPNGYSPKVEEGILFYAPQWREKIRNVFGMCVERGIPYDEEMQIVTAKGTQVWVRTTGEAVRDEKGRIIGAQGAFQDISEQKRNHFALIQAKEQAEAASKAKSAFLANMSHEIRTPLNGIMAMMQLLEMTRLDEEQNRYVSMAMTSTDRLTRLLSDLLDISRIEAGKMTIREAEFRPQELCRSVFELFMLPARSKGIRLQDAIDAALPARLLGDESRLRQILFNLVGNAVKFTERGEVRLEISPLHSRAGFLNVLISVMDTGIGIPAEHLDELFQPFSQVENSYTRKFQGAGLGLSIVRRIVELMGGHITMDSMPGEGTEVHVMLPFKLLQDSEERDLEDILRDDGHAGTLRVLLVEDELLNAFAIRSLLEKCGHEVIVAENGRQALELLAKNDIDVILMDVQMPIMDGLESTKAIRSSAGLGPKRDIPIIALTACAMSGDREKFLAAGMNGYLGKPVKLESLIEALQTHTPRLPAASSRQAAQRRPLPGDV